MVKQTTDVLHPLNIVTYGNISLINVVMRAILPKSHHLLSAAEVAEAIETQVQRKQEAAWPSWSVSLDLLKAVSLLKGDVKICQVTCSVSGRLEAKCLRICGRYSWCSR